MKRSPNSAGPRQQPGRTDDQRWRAVAARDRRADGDFVYAVRTTRIFCLPSCSARKPRRENVVFFSAAEAAQRSGFRPCKRCRPLETPQGNVTEGRIAKAVAYLSAHTDRRVSLGELASAVGISPFHLQRKFKAIVGVSPKRYQDAKRSEHLRQRLRAGDTVSRASYEAGYGSSRGVYEATKRLGITPGSYRRGGKGMHIEYTIMPSALGRVLVASTARGICAVTIGDDDALLEAELRKEFPEAETERRAGASRGLRTAVRSVRACLEGHCDAQAVPLDLQGTPFQMRVWEALQSIPAGETRTYGEIANAIGSGSAARAVGSACAGNRIALFVPCHRAVRGDGGAGGYRWGIERKQRLLDRERMSK